jgi:hypothetical protein
LTKARHPALVIMEAFHIGRQSAMLSTMGWSADAGRPTIRGIWRYLEGKGVDGTP